MKNINSKLKPAFAIALGLTLLGTGCSSSNTSAGTLAAAEAAGLVCRSEMRTGSRFPVRTCLTPEEWEEIDQAQADQTAAANQRRGIGNSGAGD